MAFRTYADRQFVSYLSEAPPVKKQQYLAALRRFDVTRTATAYGSTRYVSDTYEYAAIQPFAYVAPPVYELI